MNLLNKFHFSEFTIHNFSIIEILFTIYIKICVPKVN